MDMKRSKVHWLCADDICLCNVIFHTINSVVKILKFRISILLLLELSFQKNKGISKLAWIFPKNNDKRVQSDVI